MRYDDLDSDEKFLINNYRELRKYTAEEREIIRNYRQLSKSQKKAVLASKWSFQEWIKESVRWVWDRIVEYAMQEALTALFNYLKQQFFGS